ncbi:lipoprotein, putative, partial [Listeria ivanovii FSL F6-596]
MSSVKILSSILFIVTQLIYSFTASCCKIAKNSAPYLSRFIAPIPLISKSA